MIESIFFCLFFSLSIFLFPSSSQNDEPNSAIAQRNLQHFDHTFKASIYAISGSHYGETFGECKAQERPISLVCKASGMDLIEDVGITARKQATVNYPDVRNSFFIFFHQYSQLSNYLLYLYRSLESVGITLTLKSSLLPSIMKIPLSS